MFTHKHLHYHKLNCLCASRPRKYLFYFFIPRLTKYLTVNIFFVGRFL